MGSKTKIDWCDSQRKKILTKQGYVLVWNPNHPNANKGKGKGYIFEHRLVMSEHLGRALEKNEVKGRLRRYSHGHNQVGKHWKWGEKNGI